ATTEVSVSEQVPWSGTPWTPLLAVQTRFGSAASVRVATHDRPAVASVYVVTRGSPMKVKLQPERNGVPNAAPPMTGARSVVVPWLAVVAGALRVPVNAPEAVSVASASQLPASLPPPPPEPPESAGLLLPPPQAASATTSASMGSGRTGRTISGAPSES